MEAAPVFQEWRSDTQDNRDRSLYIDPKCTDTYPRTIVVVHPALVMVKATIYYFWMSAEMHVFVGTDSVHIFHIVILSVFHFL